MTAIALIQSVHAHRLLAAKGPFASIYFDDSHDTQDAASRLEARWRELARELEDHGAGPALVSVLKRAVLEAAPAVGHSGRGLVATADGVLIDEHFLAPPPSAVVRVSDLPYLVPLIEYGPVLSTYVVVAVDNVGAELSLYQGRTVRTETVEAGGYPVHKVPSADSYNVASRLGTHSGTQEHGVEEELRKNVRAVADAMTEQCDRDLPEVVFIIGQDRIRAELVQALPERVKVRVVRPRVGARHTGVDETVSRAITLELQNRRLLMATEVAHDYRAELGRQSGLAVEGLGAVCAGLREEAVATLILGDLGDETVLAGDDPTVVATDPEALSAFGVPPTRTLRADEAIPFAAIACGANLVPAADDLHPTDGVAALLRYAAVAPLQDES